MSGIDVIGASAGTGKTHRLTVLLSRALRGCDGAAVRPEAVMAITYMRKAARELESRLRTELMRDGRYDDAARIRDGYLGTIHAVCQRLCREHALEAGLSPALELVPEGEQQRLMAQAIADVTHARDDGLDTVARRLGLDDWHGVLRAMVKAARANRLDPATLAGCAARSVAGVTAFLPPVRGDEGSRDQRLLEACDALLPVLRQDTGTKAGAGRLEQVLALRRALRSPEHPAWGLLAGVQASIGGVKKVAARPEATALLEALGDHESHPRLRADLETMTAGLFDLASRALTAFQERKARAGVLDYDDMLAVAYDLLGQDEVAETLSERLELLVVDEFQDISPLQLAIVVRLAELAGRAVWVGDPKQAILGFQGSDPELMRAAQRHVLGGRTPEMLDRSWRSRPALVQFTSELFAHALARHGYDEQEVRITAAQPDPPELEGVPWLECWSHPRRRAEPDQPKPTRFHAIAEGVAALLAEGAPVRVRRPGPGEPTVRPAEPRDIAVLAYRNSECRHIADALRERGIPAAVSLGGLTGTPEGKLALAALGVLADPEAGVAAALVSWLSGAPEEDPDGWLAGRLREVAAWRERCDAAAATDEPRPPAPAAFADDPVVARLRARHAESDGLSPSEALDVALSAAGVHERCLGWPEPEARLANLEALRAAARAYEELCRVERTAATAVGLLAHLRDLEPDDPANAQATPTDPNAVHVLTWHSSKGLEWPIVVLSSLDVAPRASVNDLEVLGAPDGFDAAAPLRGRGLRYWAWPYGRKRAGVPLGARLDEGADAARVRRREEAERGRLLYVGFTRPRDRLVLFAETTSRGPATGWLDTLRESDDDDASLLSLPWGGDDGDAPHASIESAHSSSGHPCVVRTFDGMPPAQTGLAPEPRRALGAGERAASPPRVPERLRPSSARFDAARSARVAVGRVVPLGSPLAPAGQPAMDRLGSAVHAFLAGDRGPAAPAAEREAIARAQLEAFAVSGALVPSDVVALADRFDAELSRRWPQARRHRELPVRAWREGRLLVGEIDLLLDLGDRLIIIDHKSVPWAGPARHAELATAYAPQLALYAAAAQAARGVPVESTWLHLPLSGTLVEVLLPEPGAWPPDPDQAGTATPMP
ncbi:MAG: UvrD-helicase domain-containing protein [Deltaproteobacteria bacterium]|nr:UvrD-helicase domain-containing protein [Deltaproteobacteria bacterium]MCB9787174.1 UvrD-helicase domain-containing protein [Deltaproteobacteria bacterium]